VILSGCMGLCGFCAAFQHAHLSDRAAAYGAEKQTDGFGMAVQEVTESMTETWKRNDENRDYRFNHMF